MSQTAVRTSGVTEHDDSRSRRGRRGTDPSSGGWGWVLPALAVIVFVQLIPICYAVWLSTRELRGYAPSGDFVGFDNYVQQLTSPEFWHAMRVGAIYALSSVFCQLAVGLGIALLLNKTFRGRGITRALTFLPYMIPTATTALILGLMFNNIYGIVDQVLMALHIIDEPILFFGSSTWALPASIFAATWQWTPFMVIMLLSRLQSIDHTLYESASVEGARAWRLFRDITLPSLRSVILLIVLLRTIWMFNKFDIPYLLTKGGPLGQTTNLPIYAYDVNFQQLQRGDGASLAVLMSVLLLAFAVPYFMFFKPERELETE